MLIKTIRPLAAVLAVVSVVACSSDDSSSDDSQPTPAASSAKTDPAPAPAPAPAPGPQSAPATSAGNPGQPIVAQSSCPTGPSACLSVSNGSNQYFIPNSTVVGIRFPIAFEADPEKVLNLPGTDREQVSEENLPQLTTPVIDASGRPVFAAGSRLIGTLKMSAPKAIFNVTGVKYGSVVYNIAANAEVPSQQVQSREVDLWKTLLGAGVGAGIGIAIDRYTGDQKITWWPAVLGTGVGGALAAILWPNQYDQVQIKKDEVAVLNSGLR